jgi:hypothetical protein
MEGAAGLLIRRHVLGCLRDRGDDAHPRRGRAGQLQIRPRAVGRGGRLARDRHVQLPPDDPGLSQRRRQLHRGPREPGRDRRARRCRIASHGLRTDGVGERIGRDSSDLLRHPRPQADNGPAHRLLDPRGHGGQPARPPRQRHAIRQPHLHIHRLDAAPHRRRSARVAHGPAPPGDRRRPVDRPREREHGRVPAMQSVRRRLLGNDRNGGRSERRARIQARGVEERPADHDHHGHSAGDHVPGHELPRGQHRRPPGDGRSGQSRWGRVGALAGRPHGVRRPGTDVLHPPVLDDGHPHPGCEH